MVPTMIGMLLNSDKFDPARLASLKYLTYGASPMPEGLLIDLIERMPDLNIIQGYGQTELAPIVTTLSPNIMCWGAIIPNCVRRGVRYRARRSKSSMRTAIRLQGAMSGKFARAAWVPCKAIGN